MKRLALVAAVFAVAACTTKKDQTPADTAAPAMPAPAVAPAPGDTGMMKMDTGMMKMDTGMMKKDTMGGMKKKP